ncbi:FolE GTP cyclohydrolase I [uncultured Caudovirales phage]|uniref:GTP cyclohydrolase I n=1 Tax=uncultured Caudovirales phage TaxID=2100421 RepID=A0A6J5QSS1_9CAUD|nr:FolE GTP cyclohydrolase I [uncultured Caudovirales phage]CAB4219323.1 FolE GTP cyclohydrolase I [uncultured Caudovirales phage]
MSILTESIKNRIKQDGGSFFANDNIAKYFQGNELELLQNEVEEKIKDVLETLIIDIENDHNTQETAKRVAKMYIKEVFSGRYVEPPKITEFPNAKQFDEIYTLGPITIRSACSHHLVPITGRAWIGILPSDRVIGISKFVRLVNWIMARPQIQEEATVQLADIIERLIAPRGLAIVIEAKHQCMTWRGVKESETAMTSSVMRGVFRDKPEARAEFLRLIK